MLGVGAWRYTIYIGHRSVQSLAIGASATVRRVRRGLHGMQMASITIFASLQIRATYRLTSDWLSSILINIDIHVVIRYTLHRRHIMARTYRQHLTAARLRPGAIRRERIRHQRLYFAALASGTASTRVIAYHLDNIAACTALLTN